MNQSRHGGDGIEAQAAAASSAARWLVARVFLAHAVSEAGEAGGDVAPPIAISNGSRSKVSASARGKCEADTVRNLRISGMLPLQNLPSDSIFPGEQNRN